MRKDVTVSLVGESDETPVAHLVQLANQFDCSIYFEMESKKVNAKSIMGMMSLVLSQGDKIVIDADGEDEEEAISELEKFLSE